MVKMMSKIMAKILILALLVAIAGCQTFKGVLTDVGWTANKLADNINPAENQPQ